MLVVNGVDAQTNSHETGRLFNWTGSNAEGKPSMSALHAASTLLTSPYRCFWGESRTVGIIGYNRFDDVRRLKNLAQPRVRPWDSLPKRTQAEFDRVDGLVSDEVARLADVSSMSPRQRQTAERFALARANRDPLAKLAISFPTSRTCKNRNSIQLVAKIFGTI